jgi:phenylpropionate dioxygenase-like ring-hydroxylating dioxygenase large terminal subunit
MASAPPDLFDPRHYRRVRLPADEAETLPSWCYSSQQFFEREIDRVFKPAWNCAGRVDRCVEPGDYAALSLAGVPVILLRDDKGALRAFANSCRHRGMQLLAGAGRCKGIKCPFHGWFYRLDGRLAAARDMKATKGFERSDFGLIEFRVETAEGFVFVNLDREAPPLQETLRDFAEVLAPYRLAEMVCTRRRNFEVACNWKLFVEVFMEYYHLNAVHPHSLDTVDYQPPDPPDPVRGQFVTQFGEHEGTSGVIKGRGHATLPPIAGLDGRLLGGTRYTLVYPALIFGATTDSMWYFECTPLAPDRTRVVMASCFPRETAGRGDFQEIARGYYARWDEGIDEDNAVLERQQRGLSSPFAPSGRLSHLECLVAAFGKWIAERVSDSD